MARNAEIRPPIFASTPSSELRPRPAPAMLPMLNTSPPKTISTVSR